MPGNLSSNSIQSTENMAPTVPPAAAAPSSSPFPLEDLAWQCTKNAVLVSQYLSSENLPQPSHAADGPSTVLPASAPQNVRQARQSLMDAALQLFQLAAGPSEFVPNLAPGVQYISCVAWLIRYDIFHLVPMSGAISYTDLATTASRANSGVTIPEERLKSIIRMAMTSALFLEPEPNRICHSATSSLLARDADVHSWASYLSTRSAPTALAMTAAHGRFSPSSVAKNETAYNVAFNTELPFFEHLKQNPEGMQEFAGYMRNVTTSDGLDIKHLVNGYPWETLSGSGGLVVDVGGSTGNAAIALSRAYPDLRFVVQDLPENADAGRKAAEKTLPRDILERVTFQGHDFTQPQTVEGADVYLLRMILHDWPDHVAVAILKNLVPVLEGKDGEKRGRGKILIMDTVLPAPGQVPSAAERIVRVRDLTMMQVFNSHERDLEQWRQLLEKADERLRLARVIEPFGSAMALLEVELDTSSGDDDDDGFQQEEEDDEENWDISG
ncbi:6-hydroxytryprostatin B O-methyltransferase [Diplogelasinospora grovesii]|uniref:6-hydroxytryprostatin B O-methyltransferase n=1 Tax=Diplogelasinospora grovesii TaxID=303347 RepID=A0AAN6NFB4_9PEZI|nr:6-hydroxytryprostatin B O-methyltransferase [Diplogelasinospora grovesii]